MRKATTFKDTWSPRDRVVSKIRDARTNAIPPSRRSTPMTLWGRRMTEGGKIEGRKRITHISCSSRRRRCPTAGRWAVTAAAAAGVRAFFYATAPRPGRPRPCPTTSRTCPRVSARRLVVTRGFDRVLRLPPRTRRRRGRAAVTHNHRADARVSRVRSRHVTRPGLARSRTAGSRHAILLSQYLLLDTYVCTVSCDNRAHDSYRERRSTGERIRVIGIRSTGGWTGARGWRSTLRHLDDDDDDDDDGDGDGDDDERRTRCSRTTRRAAIDPFYRRWRTPIATPASKNSLTSTCVSAILLRMRRARSNFHIWNVRRRTRIFEARGRKMDKSECLR